jgi:hypothetical protein
MSKTFVFNCPRLSNEMRHDDASLVHNLRDKFERRGRSLHRAPRLETFRSVMGFTSIGAGRRSESASTLAERSRLQVIADTLLGREDGAA